MSAQSTTDASKASADTNTTPSKEQQKPAAALEEDDEFEDFPAEGTVTCYCV
jgi:26 proteasome complex subunit DSS1